MRRITMILLWALILAEAVLLYGLYDQYEVLAREKQAVERRADVLKTLSDQAEKELADGQAKWQAEKQALLAAQKDAQRKTEEKKPADTTALLDLPMDYSVLLQGIYTHLIPGAEGAAGKWQSAFQNLWQAEDAISAPASAEPSRPALNRETFPFSLQTYEK